MREPGDVARLFDTAVEKFGALDVLVNNAGIYEFGPIEALTLDVFRKHMELNVFGYLLATKEAVKHFGPNGGSIVNMSSTVTSLGPSNAAIYTASKGAIDGLTRALSNELAPRKIRVNAVKPGVVETEHYGNFNPLPTHETGASERPFPVFCFPRHCCSLAVGSPSADRHIAALSRYGRDASALAGRQSGTGGRCADRGLICERPRTRSSEP